ncbi:uncharacterized protein F5891DRAFT_987042 [Suillus fuscotomentosus]|uniref:Uncharacterized protein n=1 Tax=Suillus fuscotomentosus TaxID=1912939 RepID=A0AAD4HC63_9AGAM|nr:uncharacterized protein F5891DRAFT_987042 [Suillus fuscotomentosus]KAG1890510.1 hypothetical protein F5891DRAFT_987042 [Suillus fuscotomentosus]
MCLSHVTCGSLVPSFDIDGDNDLLLVATLTLFAVLIPELPTSSFLTSGCDFDSMQIINLPNTLLILVPDPGGMSTMLIEICTRFCSLPLCVLAYSNLWKIQLRLMASSSTLNAEPAAVDPGFQEVLGHASLQPNTIRTLMLVKQRLCLACNAIMLPAPYHRQYRVHCMAYGTIWAVPVWLPYNCTAVTVYGYGDQPY